MPEASSPQPCLSLGVLGSWTLKLIQPPNRLALELHRLFRLRDAQAESVGRLVNKRLPHGHKSKIRPVLHVFYCSYQKIPLMMLHHLENQAITTLFMTHFFDDGVKGP